MPVRKPVWIYYNTSLYLTSFSLLYLVRNKPSRKKLNDRISIKSEENYNVLSKNYLYETHVN